MTHDEVVGLLPWYLNGTLEDAERRTVDDHLAGCTVCALELQELRAIERAMVELRAEAPDPAPTGLAEALRTVGRREAMRWWWRRTPPVARLALAAQLALLLGLGAYVGMTRGQDGFTTAAGSLGARIVVAFQPGVTEEALRRTVQDVEGTIVAGPSALGLYTIAVPVPPDRPAELERLLEALRRNDRVIRLAERAR